MKQEKQASKKGFYVGIKDSSSLRRNLLESSKAVILAIDDLDRIKEIEAEKHKLKENLKSDIREIKMLFSKLESLLPKDVLETVPKKEEKKPHPIPLPRRKPTRSEIEEQEIQKLHKHLSMIEERLAKIK